MNRESLVAGVVAGVALCVGTPAAWAAGGDGASVSSNATRSDGVVDVEAVQQEGDISSVNNPGEFLTYLAPLPGLKGSGCGIQNFCRPAN